MNTHYKAVGVALILFLLFTSGCAGAQNTEEEKRIKDAEWHYNMGAGYFESHEVPLAIKELSSAIKLNNDHAEAHHLLGFIYMGRRDYGKAATHFKEALRVKPAFNTARNNLGALYLATERWREAAEQFEKLLEEPLYATPELAHNNLGWAYYNLRKHQQALENFKMAVFLKPQMCLAHNNLGLTYQAMGNQSEAYNAFAESVRLCPREYAEPHFHLGRMKQERGDPGATNHFRRCVEISPGSTLGRRCREYLRLR